MSSSAQFTRAAAVSSNQLSRYRAMRVFLRRAVLGRAPAQRRDGPAFATTRARLPRDGMAERRGTRLASIRVVQRPRRRVWGRPSGSGISGQIREGVALVEDESPERAFGRKWLANEHDVSIPTGLHRALEHRGRVLRPEDVDRDRAERGHLAGLTRRGTGGALGMAGSRHPPASGESDRS